jgi:hypothetical protein
VSEDGLSGPDAGPVEAVEAGAVPAVAAFEAADPALAAGSPLDDPAEGRSVLDSLAGLAGFALARNDDDWDSEVVEIVLDASLAVAAVGGDGAGVLVAMSTLRGPGVTEVGGPTWRGCWIETTA